MQRRSMTALFEKVGWWLKIWFALVACGPALTVVDGQVLAGVVIRGRSTQSGKGSERAQVQVVMIQGHRERIEAGPQTTIIDADRGTLVVLNATTKTYTESSIKPSAVADGQQSSQPHFQPTGARQTIAGFKCRVFTASSTTSRGEQTVTGCFSSAVPGWREYREFNMLLARRTGRATAATLPPGLPLSLVTSLKVRYQLSPHLAPAHRAAIERVVAGRPPVVSQDLVTGIKTGKLSPSMFAVSSGYTRLRIAGPLEH